jgi:hypothetical protein
MNSKDNSNPSKAIIFGFAKETLEPEFIIYPSIIKQLTFLYVFHMLDNILDFKKIF